MGVLNYLAYSTIVDKINAIRVAFFGEFKNYVDIVPEIGGLIDVWLEIDEDIFSFAVKQAKQFIQTRLLNITNAYTSTSPQPANYNEMVKTIKLLSDELSAYVNPALISPA